MRQAIHTLRDRLEPDRPKGKPSGYVRRAHAAATSSRPAASAIDADDFEARARAGLDALQRGATERADAALTAAAARVRWRLPRRRAVRRVGACRARAAARPRRAGAARARRPQAAAGDEESAAEHLQRLAELEPLDLQAQRDLIALMLRRGRHSEALRRYELVRRRYKRAFGTEPGFALAECST